LSALVVAVRVNVPDESGVKETVQLCRLAPSASDEEVAAQSVGIAPTGTVTKLQLALVAAVRALALFVQVT
jgi:hypothetical protein